MILGIDKDIFWLLVIFVPITIVLIWSIVNTVKQRKKALQELMSDDFEEARLVTNEATVVSKRTDIVYGGGVKMPAHKIAFLVTFSVNGNLKEYAVPKEIYETIIENTSDVLVTMNEKFFAFGEAK